MTAYSINDLYSCVQGEGVHTGVPMVLIRLHGCPVGCPWCDTKETWTQDPANQVGTIAEALGTNPLWALASPVEIAQAVADLSPRHAGWVLISGGEPGMQRLAPLVAALHTRGHRVAVETSGTAPGVLSAGLDWVCCSPKVAMPGGRQILSEVVEIADEIKWVVAGPGDITRLDGFLAANTTKEGVTVCLQPLSQIQSATELCLATCQERNWRFSAQTHKYLGLR